jgi:TolB-like protein/Flp pilus assembly protein TadD
VSDGSPRPGLFEELKRRNVFRVAAMYAVAGWLLIQIGEATFDALRLPEGSLRLLILVVAAGFPLALVLGWIFDWTSEGVVRTPDDPEQAVARLQSHRRIDFAIIGLLVLALGFSVFGPELEATPSGASGLPTIAVLPFDNLSPSSEHELFSDALTEDIITLLARSPGIKVIARHSTFQYKGRSLDVRSVGRELEADYVVEGSLRPIGDRVRVTVQLMDASAGTDVWAETYDQPLADLFAIEDNVTTGIAAGVGDELFKVQTARAAQARTQSLDAWGLTWRADQSWSSEDALEAIRLDPSYGRAHAVYARNLALETLKTTLDPEAFADAVQAARRGADLAPGDTIVRTHLGLALLWSGNPQQALAVLEQIPSMSPSYADGIAWYGDALIHNGRPAEGLTAIDRAVELTPNGLFLGDFQVIRAEALIHLGRFDEAIAALHHALSLRRRLMPLAYLAGLEALSGNSRQARALMGEAERLSPGATVEGQRQAYNWYSVDDGGVHFQSLWTALQAATR